MSTNQSSDSLLRVVLVVLAVIILAPILMMVLAVPLFGMWGGMMGGFGGTGGGAMWSLGMALVWLIVVLGGGYLVYRGLVGSGAVHSDAALEELRLAYARGDLSDEEFEDRRSKLTEE
jgi:putative membrane protein